LLFLFLASRQKTARKPRVLAKIKPFAKRLTVQKTKRRIEYICNRNTYPSIPAILTCD